VLQRVKFLKEISIDNKRMYCGLHRYSLVIGEDTIEKLRHMLLDDVLPYEKTLRREQQLPTRAAPPQVRIRELKKLGTADADALAIEARGLFNVDTLLPKAEAERARREAAGISDSVEAVQPRKAPKFNASLVGKRLEVCWPYKHKDTGETVKIWASGTVMRVADGLTDKRSSRARKILPAGALLWGWDADPEYGEAAGEKWLILLPNKWNAQVQYAWRYDPCELVPPGTARPDPRAPRVDRRADLEPRTDAEASDDDA